MLDIVDKSNLQLQRSLLTITAVGVARPNAHGHATTITLIADLSAATYLSSRVPDDSFRSKIQQAKVTMASIITHGAKMDAIRSAYKEYQEQMISAYKQE